MGRIAYTEGYKYQLAKDYETRIPIFPRDHISTEYVILSASGDLIIKRGYAWDGPSGPTVDTKNFMRGSLVHDALYQLIREGHLDCKDRADALLRQMCLEDGMSDIRAWWVYKGVQGFGKGATLPSAIKPILYAP